MALRQDWEISSIHDVDEAGADDVYWITSFARNGGHAILTADRDFVTKVPQIDAIFQNELKVILLPPKWGRAAIRLQATYILLWWSKIEEALQEMSPRECRRPKWSDREPGELQKVVLNVERARRRQRQRERKSNRR